jgi:hypothetical protein
MPEELAEVAMDESSGVGAGLFQDPHHLREDARLVTRLLGLGCVPPERIRVLVNNVADRALECSRQPGQERSLAALMKVLIMAGKLELETRKYANPIAKKREHHHEHAGKVSILTPEERRATVLRALQEEAARRGIVLDAERGQVEKSSQPSGVGSTRVGVPGDAYHSNGKAHGIPPAAVG